jgi:hypothetical protein
MVGIERTILPAIAEQESHLAARAAALWFIVAFGVAKALTNYAAGVAFGSNRPPSRPDRRMDPGASGSVPPDVGLDRDRERAPRREPGPDVVNHRDYED